MAESLQESKDALIDLIIWYRDEYHKKDSVHTKMIAKITNLSTSEELEHYWKIVDGWLE